MDLTLNQGRPTTSRDKPQAHLQFNIHLEQIQACKSEPTMKLNHNANHDKMIIHTQ